MNIHHTKERTRSIACGVLLAVAVLLLIAAGVSGYRPRGVTEFAAAGRKAEVQPIQLPGGEIDVNTADLDTLVALPGIGEKLAQAIIDEREANGPFYYPEDLIAVSGIGEKKMEGMRELIRLGEEAP